MRHLDLFSGIGGFALAAEACGIRTTAFCEIDPVCQQVLQMNFPGIPIHDDVRTFNGEAYQGQIDLITGGYPCQPFSVAGAQKAFEDDRDLWPQMHRIIEAVRPTWVVGENVYGHVNLGLDRTLLDLEVLGYATSTFIISACAVGARHQRNRVWIIAQSQSERVQGLRPSGQQEPQAHAEPRLPVRSSEGRDQTQRIIEPRLGRGIDGVSSWLDGSWEDGYTRVTEDRTGRVERIKQLGNAIVPQVAIQLLDTIHSEFILS